MKNVLLQAAMKLNTNRRKKEWTQMAVRAMAMVVVFCTTYALILPALTMEGKPACGMEAHTHTDECYTLQTTSEFQCELGEQSVVAHSHGTLCYNAEGELICLLPEIEEHTHESGCYNTVENVTIDHVLACEQTETVGHTHGDGCYGVTETLVCELPEGEEHTHADECYTTAETLTCELPECEGHTHADECYTTSETVQTEEVLICELAEAVSHDHTESCLVETQQQILTCGMPEHIHEDTCYPVEESDKTQGEYLCGSGVHTHTELCYTEEGTLACTIPEHTHMAGCLVADLDLNADVESREIWEATLNDVALTGDWAVDVLAIAESQLGYQESTRNVILTEDGDLKGYTRYGDWYGIPYGDWCAMYVSFCLNYAGVENFPLESGVNRWIEVLTEQELYCAADAYTAQPGDLIFFDYDQKKDAVEEIPIDADHVGIVVELIPATETEPARIKTIEGNTGDQVAYVTYDMDDVTIIGYGILPENDNIPQTLTYTGEDYTVTVTYDKMAQLPEGVELAVEEILPDTEEYNDYYQKTLAAMVENEVAQTQEDLNISFLRFFDITFVLDGQEVEPAAPVDVKITCAEAITIGEEESTNAIHFAQDGVEILDVETAQTATQDEELVDTFTFTQNSFSVSGVVTYESRDIGLSDNSNAKFYINTLKDAFTTDPEYANYYNANSPLGTAGSFHLVGFGTVTLNTHTNGNVLANTLIANSNFGTNNYVYELTYVQTYNKVNSNSASKAADHILVIGSGNTIGTRDNNNQITINGTGIEKPYVVIQDEDTATTPFIDLDRVEAEINQISETLARYPDMNYIIPAFTNNDQNLHVVLRDPDAVAVVNVAYDDPILFRSDPANRGGIKLDGFKNGHNGTIVINVDCTGAINRLPKDKDGNIILSLPQARILVDGNEIGTSEVVDFSAGKVVWNFLNADGLTIKTQQMTGMIVAPGATVDIGQNLNGTVVAENIIVNAESHRTDFTGEITPRDVSHDLSIHKYREGYAATTLPGAVFDLYRWDGREWKLVTSNIETDAAGQFTFLQNTLDTGVAYRLVETQAPVGYDRMTEPYNFWMKNTSAGATELNTAPKSFVGEAVEMGGVLNVPNKLSPETHTIDLNLEKVWAATSDEESIPGRVTIDVYQTAVSKEGEKTTSLYKTIELVPTFGWKMTLYDLPYLDEHGTTYTYTVQEVKVDGYIAGYAYTDPTDTDDGMQISVTITNTPGEEEEGESYVLPETGGTGTYGYTLGAIALCAVAVLGYNKKKGRRGVTAP